MNKTNGCALLVVMVSSMISCGGGGSGFHTSVPGDKPLSGLSPADAKTLCTDTGTFVTMQFQSLSTKETQCRATGIALAALSSNGGSATDAQLQAACLAGYQLCQAAPADAGFTTGGTDAGAPSVNCANAMAEGASCTATVAQYSACLGETTASLQNLFPPCNQVTKATLATFTGDGGTAGPAAGPACMAFQAACPGVSIGAMMTQF
ncbi:MAG TPA: hypothetical protein VGK52_12715 [Polyangia bacterium]|jgi:hypothetical protein